MTKKLATQDGKIRIHFEDESVKVYHQVEYYQMHFNDSDKKDLYQIKLLYQISPISFKMQKETRKTNNFEWELKEQIATNIEKQVWDDTTQYSYTSNKIVAVYFGGKEIYMRKRPEQEVKK